MPSSLEDLQEHAKILSADGATIEVVKVKRQKATKLIELEKLSRVERSIMSILIGRNLRNLYVGISLL